MIRPRAFRPFLAIALSAAALLATSCANGDPVSLSYDPSGPRNGAGLLVDPRTGVELPGQFNGGF